ncbi:MAG: exodeoxyribonuclease VII large subunit [Anaerolineae bacterium]|nr:exodeoxyribonuclease VII large subunit [Anaerolineae bacterium]
MTTGSFASLFRQEDDTPWTVSGLTAYVRELFELDYRLQDLTVAGEVSNFTHARSGHLYFTLKDEQAQVKCVMWRSHAERLRFRPAEGDAVIARGQVSVYEAGGVYQLYVNTMRPAGRGDLAQAFEALKQQLAAEGLFDGEHKKPVPAFPRRIGVVTSADGAALRDILNVLRRRCALVSVLIAPTLVQGAEAPSGIVRALQWLDGRDDVDTIIVARGGGSIEDLWAFNDEQVARAIYAARHPVICGVGHETDFTIADFVADLRAPTPSAAAELAVPELTELDNVVKTLQQRLALRVSGALRQRRDRLDGLVRSLRHLGPQRELMGHRQRLDGFTLDLERTMVRRLEQLRGRHALAVARLEAISPLATLERGYAIVRQQDGQVVRRAAQVRPGEQLGVRVAEGEFGVRVTGSESEE